MLVMVEAVMMRPVPTGSQSVLAAAVDFAYGMQTKGDTGTRIMTSLERVTGHMTVIPLSPMGNASVESVTGTAAAHLLVLMQANAEEGPSVCTHGSVAARARADWCEVG